MGKRNPNGYGCVTKLKGNRSRPWCIKVTVYDEESHSKQVPIGYAETEERANILLAEYNNNPWDIDREKITLAVLYQRWSKIKMPKLGKSNQQSLRAAFKHCSKYYGVKYRSMKSYQMQDCIDNCGCAYSTQWAIKNLFGHLDRFAFEIDLIRQCTIIFCKLFCCCLRIFDLLLHIFFVMIVCVAPNHCNYRNKTKYCANCSSLSFQKGRSFIFIHNHHLWL